ncbi:uncharacterized protein LOC141655272 [Silene latifolia]|uniref:uncharacterized protein LOC141655272 n=1 Tax=Silene latifolia TaxID=37657 RepID=UPI003D77A21C
MLAISRADILRVTTPLERQVAQVLTPFSFQKFKEEYQKASQYVIFNVDTHNFVVRYYQGENVRSRRVFWDGKIAMCNCKQFEFLGILCRHILRVFIQTDCHNIPSIYLPIRWQLEDHQNTCHMADILEMGNTNEDERMDDHITNLEECRSTDDVFEGLGGTNTVDGENISCPPKLKTKGRPKNKRLKSGKETAKQIRRCSICRNPGHYGNNCPTNKENNVDPVGTLKSRRRKLRQMTKT